MGYDSKGILVLNLKYELAISFINLVKFINYYQMPRSTSSKIDEIDFERHHNNLSSVNYLMTTVKIERAFIHLRSHIYLYIIHMT
jgi:hypothetical protein